ncbi:MAG: hypothetical protein SNJ49_14660 [Chloracidobacterium sp.]|uniref:hypothetical protein n=1 Tax=Chloracidobacterium validum TaxID=2821543 RepID=UPI0031B89162
MLAVPSSLRSSAAAQCERQALQGARLGSPPPLKTNGTRSANMLAMKPFRWPPDKNDLLKAERGISFEDVTVAVKAGALLNVVPHPNQKKYPRQKIMVVEVFGYATWYPSLREMTTSS